MARDYEDIHDLDDLNDDELRELVRTHLRDHEGVDADDINVHVENGQVRLLGRVGTEGELRIAERVLTDTLGLTEVSNELVVDSIRRRESPEAIDDHLADDAEHEGLQLGDRPEQSSDEAEHLEEDLEARLYGTTDVQQAIEDGTAWIPPTGPTQEGMSGTDADAGDYGEDH